LLNEVKSGKCENILLSSLDMSIHHRDLYCRICASI